MPRLWFDEQMEGCHQTVCCLSEHVRHQMESLPVQEKDWKIRGNKKTIEEAVTEMAQTLSELLPESAFTNRWKSGEWQRT
jgi:hypothetical protein